MSFLDSREEEQDKSPAKVPEFVSQRVDLVKIRSKTGRCIERDRLPGVELPVIILLFRREIGRSQSHRCSVTYLNNDVSSLLVCSRDFITNLYCL
jgi:hypothetical protein